MFDKPDIFCNFGGAQLPLDLYYWYKLTNRSNVNSQGSVIFARNHKQKLTGSNKVSTVLRRGGVKHDMSVVGVARLAPPCMLVVGYLMQDYVLPRSPVLVSFAFIDYMPVVSDRVSNDKHNMSPCLRVKDVLNTANSIVVGVPSVQFHIFHAVTHPELSPGDMSIHVSKFPVDFEVHIVAMLDNHGEERFARDAGDDVGMVS